jgi:hypothetical protein
MEGPTGMLHDSVTKTLPTYVRTIRTHVRGLGFLNRSSEKNTQNCTFAKTGISVVQKKPPRNRPIF